VLTTVRDKLTWIKSTLLLDFQQMLGKYQIPVSPEVNINRPEQIYRINGSEFAFYGLDYAEKLHGRKQDWFWINEAMEVDKKHFDQLEMRTTTGGIIDYNPYDDGHWVFELQKRPDVAVIKSTMLDNPFLEQSIRDKIKSYEPTAENIKNGTADDYMWQVYGLGNKARLEGVIFANWDIKEIPEGAKRLGYGLDFGYTQDPTSCVMCYEYENEIYLDEILYEKGLLNKDIYDKLTAQGIDYSIDGVGDSAEPKSIQELRNMGLSIKGAEKGADSVRYGIDLLKSRRFYITRRSVNLENELRKYKWKLDRNGKATNEPVDEFNHAIDGVRYLLMDKIGRPATVKIFDRSGWNI
jgi:phage terminase large subunit